VLSLELVSTVQLLFVYSEGNVFPYWNKYGQAFATNIRTPKSSFNKYLESYGMMELS